MNKTIWLKMTGFVLMTGTMAIMVLSCNQDNEFTIGEEFIETQTHTEMIDTFTVELSTVIVDSLNTSGSGKILLGSYEDNSFGKVTCNSFFQVGLPYYDNMQITDEYDSIALILRYDGYSYGDTTKPVTVSVHKLEENIEKDDDDYLFNCTSIIYNEEPIGSIQFIPHIDTTDVISIRIADEIGMDLFNKCQNDDIYVSSDEYFLSYLNGLALVADESSCNSVIGFKANEEDLVLRLYTHRIGETYEEIEYDFALYEEDKQFNQIIHDFSMTPLKDLKTQREELPFYETGGNTFVQGGTGIMTRVRFPYLEELLWFQRGVIMNVELILTPDKASYYDFALPETLVLYETDITNSFGDLVYDDNGYVLTADFVLDEIYHENTSYTFNITSFINNELADDYFNPDHGLLINLPTEQLLESFERLIIDPEGTKLKIYYLTY